MDWAPFGKLGKTHGLKGELKLYPFLQDPDLCAVGSAVCLAGEGEHTDLNLRYIVESIRGSSSIIKFKSCHTIEDAKALCGYTVLVPRKNFKRLVFN